MDLTGTTAVVTGAASGLGAATARALAERGVRVHGFDLPGPLERAAAVPGVQYAAVDVTDPAQVDAAVAAAAATGPLRVAVNCAGIAPGQRIVRRSGAHDPELFATVIRVNLIGTFQVLNAAANRMAALEPVDEAGQRGVIVNTASIAAFEGQIGQVAYATSKGGVHAMTLVAARDLAAHGIRVCSIAPGVVDTPMLAQLPAEGIAQLEAGVPFPSRLARPEEYARLVAMIIDHDYLNGETIRMDGALRMPPR